MKNGFGIHKAGSVSDPMTFLMRPTPAIFTLRKNESITACLAAVQPAHPRRLHSGLYPFFCWTYKFYTFIAPAITIVMQSW